MIIFKNIANALKNFVQNSDEIYLGTETAENKLLKRSEVEDVAEDAVLVNVPASDADNFQTNTGVTHLKSIYGKKSTFAVDFTRYGEYGSKDLPIYQFLTLNTVGAINLNTAIVYHCGLVSPVLFDNIWETPSATYDDQAAMIAAQGSQTVDLVYNYGTNYWRYLGTTNGNISDYEVVPSIVYKGDSYLTGIDNVNVLTFEFKQLHKESTYVLTDCVVVTNVSMADGNKDTNKPILELLLDFQFNGNKNIATDPSLDNSSAFWGGTFEGTVTPNTNASFVDLGSGNYSIRTNESNNNTTGGVPFIDVSTAEFNKIMSLGKITVLTKARRVGGTGTSDHFVFVYGSGSEGLQLKWDLASGRVGARIDGASANGTSSSVPFELGQWLEYGFTYSNPDDRTRHYVRALGYTPPLAFALRGSNTVSSDRPITSTASDVVIGAETSLGTTGKRQNLEFDYCIAIADELPDTLVEDIMDSPSTVESILRTYYGR